MLLILLHFLLWAIKLMFISNNGCIEFNAFYWLRLPRFGSRIHFIFLSSAAKQVIIVYSAALFAKKSGGLPKI